MSNVDDSALSTVEAYHQAWTSGDVDRALTYVSDSPYSPIATEISLSGGQQHQATVEPGGTTNAGRCRATDQRHPDHERRRGQRENARCSVSTPTSAARRGRAMRH